VLKIKEAIVEAVMTVIKADGKEEMEIVLENIKQHNDPGLYENTLRSLYSNFSLLKEVTDKSKTKVDDGIVDLILDAVKAKAESDKIVLLN